VKLLSSESGRAVLQVQPGGHRFSAILD